MGLPGPQGRGRGGPSAWGPRSRRAAPHGACPGPEGPHSGCENTAKLGKAGPARTLQLQARRLRRPMSSGGHRCPRPGPCWHCREQGCCRHHTAGTQARGGGSTDTGRCRHGHGRQAQPQPHPDHARPRLMAPDREPPCRSAAALPVPCRPRSRHHLPSACRRGSRCSWRLRSDTPSSRCPDSRGCS